MKTNSLLEPEFILCWHLSESLYQKRSNWLMDETVNKSNLNVWDTNKARR